MQNVVNAIPVPRLVVSTGGFVLHFLEMLAAMGIGMLALHGVLMAVPALDAAIGDHAGLPYQVLMALAMTVPMVAWMRVRGHGWRHGVEMSIGMLVPWAAVLVLVGFGAASALPWLATFDHPAMMLGMLAAMLLRLRHYTGAGHAHS